MTKASNLSSLYIAEESALKVMPDGSSLWRTREPNSYSTFGGKISKVARRTINPSRQKQKGTTTDIEVASGWQEDLTMHNMLHLLMGFLFADSRDKAATQPVFGTAVDIAAVTADYTAVSGLDVFLAGDLVLAEDFTTVANNGLKLVTAADADSVSAAGLVAEAAPPAEARLTLVGQQMLSGDVSLDVDGNGVITLTSAGADFRTLLPGEFIVVGGDSAPTLFATCPRFRARVRTASATAIVADDVVVEGGGTVVDDAGATRTLQIFFGGVIRNEPQYEDIIRRSYICERRLGEGATDTQAEYTRGNVPNEFVMNIPGQDKVVCDLTFAGLDSIFKSGESGFEILSPTGDIEEALKEECFNTSTDLKFVKLAIATTASSQATLVAFATEATLSISNGVEPSKALGVIGGIDAQPDDFDVTGNVQAYFEDTASLEAIRNNLDLSLTYCFAKSNLQKGLIFDVPLVTVSGEPNVEKDNDIMIPLELEGAESKFGHTLLVNWFEYLPVWAAA